MKNKDWLIEKKKKIAEIFKLIANPDRTTNASHSSLFSCDCSWRFFYVNDLKKGRGVTDKRVYKAIVIFICYQVFKATTGGIEWVSCSKGVKWIGMKDELSLYSPHIK